MAGEFNLDVPASQTQFAQLLGCSQPAVSKHVQKGTLPKGGTYRQWFVALYQHLAEEAAGRGGSLQDELNKARIESEKVKAANGRLDYETRIGSLVPTEWAAQALRDWAAQANREYQSGIKNFAAEIQSVHKIQINPELTTKHAGTVIARIADHADKLAGSVEGSSN